MFIFVPFLACGITYTAGTFPTTVSSSDPQFSPYSNNIDCTLNFDQSASDVTLLEFQAGFAVEEHPTCIWDALEVRTPHSPSLSCKLPLSQK